MTKPNYFAIIPADVRYNKELPDKAKLLYAEITCLCNFRGNCWATNEYFARLYEVNTETISRNIQLLEKHKLIRIKYVYNGNVIIKRVIAVAKNHYGEAIADHKKRNGADHKKRKENIKITTSTINIKNNTSATVKNPVGVWCEKFKAKFGEQYIITPKDAGHLNRVYKLIPERFESKIDAFFEVDNWAHEYNVSIFQATLNKTKAKEKPSEYACTEERLEAMLRRAKQ
jgi:hypothetical protein